VTASRPWTANLVAAHRRQERNSKRQLVPFQLSSQNNELAGAGFNPLLHPTNLVRNSWNGTSSPGKFSLPIFVEQQARLKLNTGNSGARLESLLGRVQMSLVNPFALARPRASVARREGRAGEVLHESWLSGWCRRGILHSVAQVSIENLRRHPLASSRAPGRLLLGVQERPNRAAWHLLSVNAPCGMPRWCACGAPRECCLFPLECPASAISGSQRGDLHRDGLICFCFP